MSALKLACERAEAVVKLPRRGDRIEIARAEQRIKAELSRRSRVKEAWAQFLARIDPTIPSDPKLKDLKRLAAISGGVAKRRLTPAARGADRPKMAPEPMRADHDDVCQVASAIDVAAMQHP